MVGSHYLCYRLIVAEYRCKDLCVAHKVGAWFPCNTPLRWHKNVTLSRSA